MTRPSILLAALFLLGPAILTAAHHPPPPAAAFDWTVGTWTGTRTNGATGEQERMTMRVEPILGGTGQARHLEIVNDDATYLGYAVQVFDAERNVWVRQYTNRGRGRFATLEGTVEKGRSVWRSVTPGRRRESKLISERLLPGTWRRTMHVSEDGGQTWRVLWIDELQRDSR